MLFLGDPLCGSRPNFTADFLDVEVEDKLPTGRSESSWCGCRCGQPLPKFASQRGNNPSSISDSAVFQSSPEPRRNSFIRSSVTHLSPGQRSAGIHTHRATSAPSAFVACINSSVVFPSVPFGPRHTRTQADTRACTHAHTVLIPVALPSGVTERLLSAALPAPLSPLLPNSGHPTVVKPHPARLRLARAEEDDEEGGEGRRRGKEERAQARMSSIQRRGRGWKSAAVAALGSGEAHFSPGYSSSKFCLHTHNNNKKQQQQQEQGNTNTT